MSENKNMEKLSFEKIQEMLPDYVFQRLTLSETKAFENNIDRYPELKKEITDVKRVFSKVNRMNIDERIKQRTRNLSIKVKNEMRKEREKKGRFIFGVRYVMPLVGLIVVSIIFYIYFMSLDSEQINDQQYARKTLEMVKPQEVLAVLSDTTINQENLLDLAAETYSPSENIDVEDLFIDDESFNDSVDEYLAEMLFEEIEDEEYITVLNKYGNSYDIIITLDELTEDNFQSILEDIENEDFL